MARREPRAAAAALEEELRWSVWPARERPWAALVLIASTVVLGALIAKGTGDRVLGIAAPLFVLGSLGSFLGRTEYRLTPEAIEVRTLGVVRTRPWTEMRRATVDRSGLFLSPFEKRNWLEAYRGVRLLFGGNRDQVVAFVETRLRRSVEVADKPSRSGRRGSPGSGAPAPDRAG